MEHVDGLLMFTNGYHSMMLITSSEPRVPFADRFAATNEEKIAAFDTNTANAGTYEVSDGMLITHPLAAKNPGFVAGRGEYEYRIEGDTLHLSTRGIFMSSGDQSIPGSNIQRVEYEFVRLK